MPRVKPRTVAPTETEIIWPFVPLAHQLEVFKAFNEGFRKFVLVWHRRAGKGLALVNFTWTRAAMPGVPGYRKGTYYHFFPTYGLGKRVLWDGMDNEGKRFLDYIPKELIFGEPNETELQVTFKDPDDPSQPGSIWQIIGCDKMDKAARGTNVVGMVFDEYQDMTARVQQITRPIINANQGWEMYIGTPRGHNHFFQLLKTATKTENTSRWWTSVRDITMTRYNDGRPMVDESMIENDRKDGIPEDIIQQENYCSFEGYQEGGFFADLVSQAYREQRIGDVPNNPQCLVNTVSDLGVSTADELKFCTWFFQVENLGGIRVIDFHELESGAIPEFVQMIRQKPYLYDRHYAPFDIKSKDISTGKDRITTARHLGVNFVPIPRTSVTTRINAGRQIFPRCIFDEKRTADGIIHLQNYRRKRDDVLNEFTGAELHDAHSHGGSAFSYMGLAFRESRPVQQESAVTDFNIFTYDKEQTVEIEFDPFVDVR